jgi:hypothetical protein
VFPVDGHGGGCVVLGGKRCMWGTDRDIYATVSTYGEGCDGNATRRLDGQRDMRSSKGNRVLSCNASKQRMTSHMKRSTKPLEFRRRVRDRSSMSILVGRIRYTSIRSVEVGKRYFR